MNESMSIAINI